MAARRLWKSTSVARCMRECKPSPPTTSTRLVQGLAFYVARIASPFSGSIRLNGLEAQEQQALFALLTGSKAPGQFRSEAPAPAP